MNNELHIAHKIRLALNEGTDSLDRDLSTRLHAARQAALARQRQPVALLSIAGLGALTSEVLLPRARAFSMALALLVGAVGTYYWNDYDQASENEEIDSALLSDELPINAYLDRGFQTWVDHSSPSAP